MRLRVASLAAWIAALSVAAVCVAQSYFVSPSGSDAEPGTEEKFSRRLDPG